MLKLLLPQNASNAAWSCWKLQCFKRRFVLRGGCGGATRNGHQLPSTDASAFCIPLSPQDTLCRQQRPLLLLPPLSKPPTRATDLLTHTWPYGTAGTRLHTVIRGMVADSVLCRGVGQAGWLLPFVSPAEPSQLSGTTVFPSLWSCADVCG